MIIGIYSDLHSNLAALHSMVSTFGGIDLWLCLGDSVGIFPDVNEVITWQRNEAVIAVAGDHEKHLLRGESIANSYTGTQAIKLQRQSITPDNFNYLAGLSDSLDLTVGGLKIHISHYVSNEQKDVHHKYFLDQTQIDKLYGEYDFKFFGHTHLPTTIFTKETIAINPGSAGFPIDITRHPSAMRLDTKTRKFDLIRFNFDKILIVRNIVKNGYNPKLIEYLNNGNRWK